MDTPLSALTTLVDKAKKASQANEAARDLRKLVDSVKHGEAACQAAQDLRDRLQQISNEAVKVSKTIHCEGDGTGPATPPDDPKFKQLAALKDKAKALNEQLKTKQKELADARQSLESTQRLIPQLIGKINDANRDAIRAARKR